MRYRCHNRPKDTAPEWRLILALQKLRSTHPNCFGPGTLFSPCRIANIAVMGETGQIVANFTNWKGALDNVLYPRRIYVDIRHLPRSRLKRCIVVAVAQSVSSRSCTVTRVVPSVLVWRVVSAATRNPANGSGRNKSTVRRVSIFSGPISVSAARTIKPLTGPRGNERQTTARALHRYQ